MDGSLDGWKYAWMKAWMDGGEIHYLGEASHTELKDSCRVLVSTCCGALNDQGLQRSLTLVR